MIILKQGILKCLVRYSGWVNRGHLPDSHEVDLLSPEVDRAAAAEEDDEEGAEKFGRD